VNKSLAAKRILVTGASRGLGLAIAREMSKCGGELLLVSSSDDRLRNAVAALRSERPCPPLHSIAADLAQPEAAAKILDQVSTLWGNFDVLVNNAAIVGPIGPLWENDWVEWVRTIQVNLLSPVAICRLSVPLLNDGAVILNLSGGGATAPRPRFSAYGTAKAGLVRFSETLAAEVQDRRIRVNCIAPGAMNTQMLEQVLRAGADSCGNREYEQARKQEAQGGVSPELAAELCVFLASESGRGISGRLISAVWDPWKGLGEFAAELRESDIYTLRRVLPNDRGKTWG